MFEDQYTRLYLRGFVLIGWGVQSSLCGGLCIFYTFFYSRCWVIYIILQARIRRFRGVIDFYDDWVRYQFVSRGNICLRIWVYIRFFYSFVGRVQGGQIVFWRDVSIQYFICGGRFWCLNINFVKQGYWGVVSKGVICFCL